MQIASLVVLSLLILLPGRTSLTGTWALDRLRSDFGAAVTPRQFSIRFDQEGNHLAVTTVMVDEAGMHVTHRLAEQEGLLLRVNADAANVNEYWRVTSRHICQPQLGKGTPKTFPRPLDRSRIARLVQTWLSLVNVGADQGVILRAS